MGVVSGNRGMLSIKLTTVGESDELHQYGEVESGAALRRGAWRWLVKLAPVLALAVVSFAALYFTWRQQLRVETLAIHHIELESLVAEHPALAFGVYFGLYVLLACLSLPGCVILSAAGGFLFGWLVGALTAVFGATTGATFFFLLARTSLGDAVTRRTGSRVERLCADFHEDALSYLLFLRLTPAFPFGAVNLAAAFLNMKLRDFAIGTFVGIIPASLVFAAAGASIDHLLDVQNQNREACLSAVSWSGAESEQACVAALAPADLITSETLLLLAALGILSLVPVVVKKFRKYSRRDA
jgi:uncharacterized membrane protein YdjX (TVP38/TMEM64 family)